jgi:hypothetical protein
VIEGLVLTFATVSTMYLLTGFVFQSGKSSGSYNPIPYVKPGDNFTSFNNTDFCQVLSKEMEIANL